MHVINQLINTGTNNSACKGIFTVWNIWQGHQYKGRILNQKIIMLASWFYKYFKNFSI